MSPISKSVCSTYIRWRLDPTLSTHHASDVFIRSPHVRAVCVMNCLVVTYYSRCSLIYITFALEALSWLSNYLSYREASYRAILSVWTISRLRTNYLLVLIAIHRSLYCVAIHDIKLECRDQDRRVYWQTTSFNAYPFFLGIRDECQILVGTFTYARSVLSSYNAHVR